jgi:hypothetical protein
MKKIVMVSILLISFIMIAPQICFCNEPPSCPLGWTIIGPPVVGTWVVDYVSGAYPNYNLSFKFKGCCANCFDGGKTSKVNIEWLDTLPVMPEEIELEVIQDYSIPGRGPGKCNPIVEGTELKDLVVTTILKFDNQTDIDGDGYKELVADVVMYYWVCNQ